MWAGLTVAYLVPVVPPSFGILAVATAVYLGDLRLVAGAGGADRAGPAAVAAGRRSPDGGRGVRVGRPGHAVVCPA